MSRCKKCGRNLSADETALHKKLYCRGATEFFCIECSAEYLNVSAELLPNIREAETADIVIMNCSGTPEKYRVCEIYYYNSVSAFSEKTAQFEIESGGFIKIMAPKSFDENILAADSLIIQDFNLN